MKKILTLVQVGISSTFGKQQQANAMCLCQCNVVADSITFNENGELIFVNKTFNLETETKAFESYTKTNTDMEVLNPDNLKDSDKNVIHIYNLKVGYSPNEYSCFKYNGTIYVLKEDQGRYLLPIAERSNDKSFKEKIDWVCVIGSDKDGKDQKQNYFLLKQKFENNKNKALILDDFISKNKFKGKTEKMQVTIFDEEKEKEKLKQNQGTITINNIQINIGAINTINQTQNKTQSITVYKK